MGGASWCFIGLNDLIGDYIDAVESNEDYVGILVDNLGKDRRSKMRISVEDRLQSYKSERLSGSGTDRIPHLVAITGIGELIDIDRSAYIFLAFSGTELPKVHQECERIFGTLKSKALIHSTACISKKADISSTSSILAGSIVSSGVAISEYARINKGVIIGHDTFIGELSVIQPGVKIGGHCKVEKGAYIGIGSTIIQDIVIGEYATVAAGSVVTRDVPPRSLVAGVPATVKREAYTRSI
jgi:UDP-3-O-[3-hydroxymyristoyl] glucosamine N-acyltransferase